MARSNVVDKIKEIKWEREHNSLRKAFSSLGLVSSVSGMLRLFKCHGKIN